MKKSLCDGWEFTGEWSDAFLSWETEAAPVRLPHTCREIPLHYADHESYQMVCGYRRELELPPEANGRRIFLQFDGAAHIATVFVNGKETVTHRCGYTAFRVEITDLLVFDGPNRVAVRLDTTENAAVPPFGFVIDYLTYGGLYREVWLDVRPACYIEDVYVTTPTTESAVCRVKVDRPARGASLSLSVLDGEGNEVWQGLSAAEDGSFEVSVPGAAPWEPDHPARYTASVALLDAKGTELDRQEVKFGFRTAQFKADGFYLNGKKTFLRGLNRHQCFPWIGYAAPEHLQREDARILKEELGCTAVRTSHYPQSHHFIDECDRIGLLVFTEIPGWQYIGDATWKDQAVENVREMVVQYRSHPSIVLWGVRINESLDDDEFYARTNALAHELDPSRATSGVRYLEQSHLLEDVYAFNDFSHTGDNGGARPKKAVTPDMSKALLISECNGHMYPTKPFDTWERRQEHALRHVRVQDAALADGEHAGCFGWCMFDYPTHKDFGSGDRVCYHGVTDFFRNPKTAAAVYASQSDARPVLEVASSMDIGDYPGGQVGTVYVFSNADKVSLYKNGTFVTDLSPSRWTALPHPPLAVDDTIGELLESQEGFPKKKAKVLHDLLLAASKHGLSGLPLKQKLKMARAMKRYHMTFEDGVALYGKYVGNWGGEAIAWRFDAVKGGQVVASVTRSPSADLRLEVTPSSTALTEGDTYDMAAVRVRVVDGNGTPACYGQFPVRFSMSGAAELAGPELVTAEGGMCGTYVRSVGRTGRARLTITCPQTAPVEVDFTVKTPE